MIRKFFALFRSDAGERTEIDDRMDEERRLIAECRKIVALPRPHPMALYWAKLRLSEAEGRLRELGRRNASVTRETEIRRSARTTRVEVQGHRHDPTTRL